MFDDDGAKVSFSFSFFSFFFFVISLGKIIKFCTCVNNFKSILFPIASA
jgi:hypothetical protein